jgi:transcriptional regulator with XRE-family HTH domain
MEIKEALRRTLFEKGISGAELARASGVNRNQISEFMRGDRALTSTNIDKLLAGLPPEALRYCLCLIAGQPKEC